MIIITVYFYLKNMSIASSHSQSTNLLPKEECWQEMKKHQPFGVVKDKHFANYQTHRAFTFLTNEGCNFRGYEDMTFETSFKNLLFADGTPFGVKVEE